MPADYAKLAGAIIALTLTASMASAATPADPVPRTFSMRRAEAWEPCPAAGTPPAAPTGKKCPTLIVDFGEAIPDPLLARITGPDAAASRVWDLSALDGSTRMNVPIRVVDVRSRPQASGLVLLVLDEATAPAVIDLNTHVLVLTYFLSDRPVVLSTTAETLDTEGGLLVDANDPDDADIYFAGKAKGIKGQGAVFSLEARLRREWSAGRHELGGIVEIVSEEEGDIDPDSITTALSYGRVLSSGPHALKLAARPFGGEFSRDEAGTRGMISSGDLIWTVVPTLAETVALDLVAGAELGTNFANAATQNGSGFLARGKIGLQGYMRWDRKFGIQRITLNGTWLVRLLGQPETDPERRDASGDPTLTKRARHRIAADLTLAVNRRVGLAIQIRGGSLPPAFERVRPSITASLTYKADWR
jgi:hypothetical protein